MVADLLLALDGRPKGDVDITTFVPGERGRKPMTVILVDPRRPAVVPIEAVELLGGDVQF